MAKNPIMNLALSTQNLCRNYAGEHALKGISLDLPTGALYGLCGPDGAGKTSLLTLLATLQDPDSGTATVLGLDLKKDFSKIRRNLGYMPQKFSLYADLTVGENLSFFANLFGLETEIRKTRLENLLQFSGLTAFQGRRASALSGGMKQKLALSCILIHEPPLLLLDEPTVGVDPVARREFWQMLHDLKRRGHSILISTPYMDEAAQCDQVAFLHEGRLIAQGRPLELLRSYPHTLLEIQAKKPLRYPIDASPPPPFLALYTSGANLHGVIPQNIYSAKILPELITSFSNKLGQHVEVRERLPDLEDFLLLKLLEDVTHPNGAK